LDVPGRQIIDAVDRTIRNAGQPVHPTGLIRWI
jgi:hypothetical protein